MSDGMSDRITLTREEMHEESERYRKAKEVRENLSEILSGEGLLCEDIPTPNAFPHQGRTTFVSSITPTEAEICVHTTPVSDQSMVITISRDFLIPADLSSDQVESLAKFIMDLADHPHPVSDETS